jgi:Flp pilus assembly protein TadD
MSNVREALQVALKLHQSRQLDQAERIYQEILAADPNYADAWHLLGLIELQTGRHEAAQQKIERAISLRPWFVFYNNLASLHGSLGRLSEAEVAFRESLRLNPECAHTHVQLSMAVRRLGRLDESEAIIAEALRLDANIADAYLNLGVIHRLRGELDQAERCYEAALRIEPEHAATQLSRALLWLLQGDFARGWPAYEWRWRAATGPRHQPFVQPRWDGAPVAGKTILLHDEQGLGDAIQFIRYAALVHERGGRVLLRCHPSLVSLLNRSAGIEAAFGHDEPLPPFDVHAPLLSLPAILQTSSQTPAATIPAEPAYLSADPALVERWRNQLAPDRQFRVGLFWSGNRDHYEDFFRSIPRASLAPLFDVPGCSFYSLQKFKPGEPASTIDDRFPLIYLTQQLGDLHETAALVSNLDLVIGCDSAPAHLAAALGVPTWLALPAAPDWRWMLEGESSPWYPTMRLFRQSTLGDWQPVFSRIAAELRVISAVPRTD